ncbi:hypothetical protein, partial [Grimontia sp. AD028]|uniref:hypothetical protein n=1 Tax=Grimontia sp. AD028 TaxID=1581149 RepID=UPI001E344573
GNTILALPALPELPSSVALVPVPCVSILPTPQRLREPISKTTNPKVIKLTLLYRVRYDIVILLFLKELKN